MLSPKTRTHLVVMLILLGIAVALLLTRPERGAILQEAIAPKVEVAPVGLHELQPVETVSGRLEPARKASLRFELSGRVTVRHAEPGQQVEQGGLLLSLASGDYEDAVAEAEAMLAQESRNIQRDRELLALAKRNYRLQKNDLERFEQLGAESLVSKSRLDETRIRLIQLESEMAELNARVNSAGSRLSLKRAASNRAARNLDRTRLTAPFAGTVNAVSVQPGDYVSITQPVVELVDATQLELYVEVRGDVAKSLQQGQAVEVEADGRGLAGEIVALQFDPDPVTYTHALRIRIEGGVVRPGSIARAHLPLQTLRAVTAVPATALLYDEGRAFVFRYSDGSLQKVEVDAGSRVGDLQVIHRGLNEADLVVLRDVAALSDGQEVETTGLAETAIQEP